MSATGRAPETGISPRMIFGAPAIVLGLLCAMYFITYVDRVNIATAATAIKTEFGFNNTDELTIGPIWSVPMDVAPKFSGTASGIMNTGSAIAGFASPVIFGWLVDVTGNWHLPFAGSIGLLLLGAVLAFWMHPDRPLGDEPFARAQ